MKIRGFFLPPPVTDGSPPRAFIRFAKAAVNLFYKKDFRGCVVMSSRALGFCPCDPFVLALRADAYLKIRDYFHAYMDYEKAIELEPWQSHLWYRRGLALIFMGKVSFAVKDLKEAYRLEPSAIYLEVLDSVSKLKRENWWT